MIVFGLYTSLLFFAELFTVAYCKVPSSQNSKIEYLTSQGTPIFADQHVKKVNFTQYVALKQFEENHARKPIRLWGSIRCGVLTEPKITADYARDSSTGGCGH